MTKRLVALFGAAAIVLGACQPASPTTVPNGSPGSSGAATESQSAGGQVDPNGVLREYLADTDPPSMNPTAANDSESIAVQAAVYRGLMYYDKDLNLVPDMAQAAPELSADGLTLTFKLKDGLKYSDGNPIVAGDFVRAFKRLANPLAANYYGYEACPIAGADALLGAEGGCPTDKHAPTDEAGVKAALDKLGVAAPDDSTFVITLAEPALYYTSILAMWLTVPESSTMVPDDCIAAAQCGKFDEAADIVASGPFMMKDWTHNSAITLVPNPNWYGAKPGLAEIDMSIGGDPEAALAAYEAGSLDLVTVPGPDILRIKADTSKQNQYSEVPLAAITYYDFNDCLEPSIKCPKNNTKDGRAASSYKNFRIALSEAIDRQDLIDVTFGGLGIPAYSQIMPGIPGYDKDLNPYPFNLDKAKTDMAQAVTDMGLTDSNKDGKVDVKDIGVMKFGYNCNASHLPRVVYLEEHWRSTFGFDQSQFDISCTDFATFLTERVQGVYQFSRDGWGADFPNAVNQLDGLFTCGGGNNTSQYCNKDLDALMKKAAGETDPAAAVADYQAAQKVAVDDAAVLWMRYGTAGYLVQPYVQGLAATAIDSQNVGERLPETISILQH
jgi:oligopeptide transport system substrate-binding protein